MRCADQRCAALHGRLEQEIGDLGSVAGIEAGSGLIGEDQRRPGDQRAGNGDALLLAPREEGGAAARVGQPHAAGERGGAFLLGRAQVPGRETRRQRDICGYVELGNQMKVLEDEADGLAAPAVPAGFGKVGDSTVAPQDAALRRPQQAGDQMQQRALATAGRAADADAAARLDREQRQLEQAEGLAVGVADVEREAFQRQPAGGLLRRG